MLFIILTILGMLTGFVLVIVYDNNRIQLLGAIIVLLSIMIFGSLARAQIVSSYLRRDEIQLSHCVGDGFTRYQCEHWIYGTWPVVIPDGPISSDKSLPPDLQP